VGAGVSAYVRDNGSTTPTIAGFCAFGGFQINDGTAKSANLGMLTGSPPIIDVVNDLPSDDGGLDGIPIYGAWRFTIDGWLYVSAVDLIQSAINDLRSVFNIAAGTQLLTFKARDFNETRQMLVRVNGQIVINDPGPGQRKISRRDFTIPLLATDPRAYDADTLRSQSFTVGSTHALVNNGNYSTPITVQFIGPLTDPYIDGPGTAGTNRIALANQDGSPYVIGSGVSVTVTTNPAAPGGVTALNNSGVSVYAKVATRSASVIIPGSNNWTLHASAGSGTAVVTSRDAWV